MDWNLMLEKMIAAGRYPSYEAMKNKIANAVLEGYITSEQADELFIKLDKKEGIIVR